MSVDLVRLEDAERHTITNQQWAFILLTAESYGWKPKGTNKFDDDGELLDDWDNNNYESNDGQVVNGEDSEQLVICCKKALNKINDNWEIKTLKSFINFATVSDDNDPYYPGFEIW